MFFLLQDWKTILERDVKSFVAAKGANDFEALRKDVYSHLDEYILEVQKAYEGAWEKAPKDLQEVDTHVRTKLACLHGETQELYHAFSRWFLAKYPPTLFFGKIIDHELSRIRFSNTSIFSYTNRILAILTKAFSLLIQCFLIIPEKSFNRLIQYSMQSYISKKIKMQIDKHLTHTEKIQKSFLRTILAAVKKPDDPDLITRTLPREETKQLQKLIEQVFDLIDYQNATSLEAVKEQQSKRGFHGLNIVNLLTKSTPLSEIDSVRNFLQSTLTIKGGKILANQLQREQLLRHCIEIIPKIYEEILNIDFSKKDEIPIDDYLKVILIVLMTNYSVEKTGYKIPGLESIVQQRIIPNSIIQGIAKPLLTLVMDPKHHVYGVIHPLMKAVAK